MGCEALRTDGYGSYEYGDLITFRCDAPKARNESMNMGYEALRTDGYGSLRIR